MSEPKSALSAPSVARLAALTRRSIERGALRVRPRLAKALSRALRVSVVDAGHPLRPGDQPGQSDRVTAPVPLAIDPVPGRKGAGSGSWEISVPGHTVLSNVQLVGPKALPLTESRELICESLGYDVLDRGVLSLRSLVETGAAPSRHGPTSNGTLCALIGRFGANYMHWLIEVMPTLRAVEAYEARTHDRVTFLVPKDLRTWQRETLELAGVDPARCVPWTGFRERIERVLVPDFPMRLRLPQRWSVASPTALTWLRDRFVARAGTGASSPDRVYVSRSRALTRRVVNEDDVGRILEARGFAVVELDDMTFRDQVRIFANARIIAGPHGAGLTNMFVAPRAWVVEIVSGHTTSDYYDLATACGHSYAYLQGHRAGGSRTDPDVFVPPAKLDRLLDLVEERIRREGDDRSVSSSG